MLFSSCFCQKNTHKTHEIDKVSQLLMTIITLHHLFFGPCVNSSVFVLVLGIFLRELRSLRKIPQPKTITSDFHTMTSKKMCAVILLSNITQCPPSNRWFSLVCYLLLRNHGYLYCLNCVGTKDYITSQTRKKTNKQTNKENKTGKKQTNRQTKQNQKPKKKKKTTMNLK